MKNKIHKIILVAAFFLFLAAMPILTFINLPKEDKPFSENENRTLAGFPEISFETYVDKSAMTGFEDWFSDRFFGREEWIKLKNGAERFIGKTEVNGIFTVDDRMMQVWKGYDKEFIEQEYKPRLKYLARCLKQKKVPSKIEYEQIYSKQSL